MQTIWGFDLGVTSVGFAVVRWDGGRDGGGAGEIVRLGVRIFPECREKDLSPRNLARRQARLARRQVRRRRWRRVHLRRLLAEAGLLPEDAARPPAGQDPYALRARGLGSRLEPHEVGWALFHLLKRRGFQGSRKRDEAAKDKKKAADDEEAQSRGQSLARKLNGQVLGTYLASIETTMEKPERRRGVGQTREMVTAELAALWAEQRKHYPGLLTDELWEAIDRTAMAQRPTYFRARTVGQCDLEPGQPRALKADWLTQQFEMLQFINSLRLEGGNQRGLDAAERAKAAEYLSATRAPSWAGLRKALGLPRGAAFTHERGTKQSVRGNATEAALRAALGPSFVTHAEADAIREAIGVAWHLLEYRPARNGSVLEIRDHQQITAERQRLAERAQAQWGLSAPDAEALSRIDLPDGTGAHSVAAMRKMLPYVEAGESHETARRSACPIGEIGKPVRFLPGPNRGEFGKLKNDEDHKDGFLLQQMERLLGGIRNPTVIRTLGELQKVVNTLLRVHGRPDMIRIETARELKQSPDERRDTGTKQSDREKARKAARAKLAELGKAADGREGDENVLRLLLWQEQGGRCPYTGETIGCSDALSAHATEIDHIFPASRSFDDAQSNKVLCLSRANRDKGGRTPFEWLGHQAETWDYLNETVWPAMRGAGWPLAKCRRCQKANFEQAGEEGFTQRQLVDTGYIARASRDYLGLLFGGGQAGINAVQPVPGRATAQLRRAWGIGLGALLHDDIAAPKARDDHRHHAVDALAVALTGPGTVQALSRWWERRETTRSKPQFAAPWEGFRDAAKAAVEAIVVSHRVQAKLSGALHEETRLGDTGERRGQFTLYVKRKPVIGLSPAEIEAIRDAAVRRAIDAAVGAAGGNLKKALGQEIRLPLCDGTPGPVIRRVRLLVPRKQGMMRTHATRNVFAKLGRGTNDHIALYQDGAIVKYLVATKQLSVGRTRKGEPTAESGHPEGGTLVMTLRQHDVLHRREGSQDEYRLVRKFNAAGQIFFQPVTMATDPKPELSVTPQPLIAQGWRKVSIDPIGRVTPAR